MKYILFYCEDCGCRFAIEEDSYDSDPGCPNCGDDLDVTVTGECIKDPKIEPDK